MISRFCATAAMAWMLLQAGPGRSAALAEDGLIPPADKIKAERPRLLLRPAPTPLAASLDQLKALARDADYDKMVQTLAAGKDAAGLAMVHLLTGDRAAADKAIARMTAFKGSEKPDSFEIYFALREAALAYDWLANYAGMTDAVKAQIRANYHPVAAHGAKVATDHIFHNYTWMAAGGTMLWALATVGQDEQADKLFETMRTRMNRDLYPAMAYLSGQFGESPGYWVLYDISPCALSLLAAQSAFEAPVLATIRDKQNDWLARQLDNVVHMTLPNMRYVTWGDIQSGGDGGVTHEVVGVTDALTWATGSPAGAHLSRWVAEKRGLRRFYEFHGIFYFLYTRQLKVPTTALPLSHLVGKVADPSGGAMAARSGWADTETVVAFRCTDFFGGHNHFDQGSFVIYRNGHLATDPDLYKRVGGGQQPTNVHNTLLLGGQGQRPLKAQWFKDVPDYQQNLTGGRKLETGDLLHFKDETVRLRLGETEQDPNVSASVVTVAGQFAQAYPSGLVASCIRQVTFIRPDRVVVIDHLSAEPGKNLPEVTWQLILPAVPVVGKDRSVRVENGKSHLVCWAWDPCVCEVNQPVVEPVLDKWQRASFKYLTEAGQTKRTLVHVLAVGDGPAPADLAGPRVQVSQRDGQVQVGWQPGRTWMFAGPEPADASRKRFDVIYQADRPAKPGQP